MDGLMVNDIFFLRDRKNNKPARITLADFVIKKICLSLADISVTIRTNQFEDDKRDYLECRNSRFMVTFIDSAFWGNPECIGLLEEFRKFRDDHYVLPILLEKNMPTSVPSSSTLSFDEIKHTMDCLDLTECVSDNADTTSISNEIEKRIHILLADRLENIKERLLDIKLKKNIHMIYDQLEIAKGKNIEEDDIKQLLEDLRLKAEGVAEKGKGDLPVCAIYTGGTVGIIHESDGVTLRQASLEEFVDRIPHLAKLKFDVHFYAYKKAIDSSNIESNQWKFLARFIETMQSQYQGFVVIHGVNTMAYTASALSFMLDDVSLPIVLTGAEYPLTDFGSDAAENVVDALNVAGYLSNKYINIPLVSVLFGKKLFRGNRATKKVSLDPADGFYSPNYPVVANITNDRIYGYSMNAHHSHDSSGGTTIVSNSFMTDPGGVVVCDIYPDMDMNVFKAICDQDCLQALILRTYGTGGVPDEDDKFMTCIEGLLKKNVLVVSLTQCPIGEVEYRLFETNAKLFYMGVLNGGDMTTEAAYTKMKYFLARHGSPKLTRPIDEYELAEKNELYQRYARISEGMSANFKGEMSINTYVVRPNIDSSEIDTNNNLRTQIRLPELGSQIICSAIIILDISSVGTGNLDEFTEISVTVPARNMTLGKYRRKLVEELKKSNKDYPLTINATDELRKLTGMEGFKGDFGLRINSHKHKVTIESLSIVISARVDQSSGG